MNKEQIIFLNGAPSAGKTSTMRALQEILEEPYLYIGIDDAYRMLPERYHDWDDPAHRETIFRAVSGINHCIATLASIGNNVVVDYLMYDGFEGYYLAECVFLLAHFEVLFVGVFCELEELERRQSQRRDRNPDFTREYLAAAQVRAHAHGIYDLEVDSTNLTPHQCAEIIKAHLRNGPKPDAFRLIREKYLTNSVNP